MTLDDMAHLAVELRGADVPIGVVNILDGIIAHLRVDEAARACMARKCAAVVRDRDEARAECAGWRDAAEQIASICGVDADLGTQTIADAVQRLANEIDDEVEPLRAERDALRTQLAERPCEMCDLAAQHGLMTDDMLALARTLGMREGKHTANTVARLAVDALAAKAAPAQATGVPPEVRVRPDDDGWHVFIGVGPGCAVAWSDDEHEARAMARNLRSELARNGLLPRTDAGEVERIRRAANLAVSDGMFVRSEDVDARIAAAVEAEREACALLCDANAREAREHGFGWGIADACARHIRDRGASGKTSEGVRALAGESGGKS